MVTAGRLLMLLARSKGFGTAWVREPLCSTQQEATLRKQRTWPGTLISRSWLLEMIPPVITMVRRNSAGGCLPSADRRNSRTKSNHSGEYDLHATSPVYYRQLCRSP